MRNQGFYAVATLAHTLARGVDLVGGKDLQRGTMKRQDSGRRRGPKPRRMRLWRMRRALSALAARVACHARQATVTLLGMHQTIRRDFVRIWLNVCRC